MKSKELENYLLSLIEMSNCSLDLILYMRIYISFFNILFSSSKYSIFWLKLSSFCFIRVTSSSTFSRLQLEIAMNLDF